VSEPAAGAIDFHDAGPADLAPGTARAVELAGQPVLVANVNGAVHAIRNKCSHAESPLAGGRIRNGFVSCPLHGARFELASGKCLGNAYQPVPSYPVKVEDGRIFVGLAA
jgi:nitrite reductase/ring-hydroxylating ferredoxin subunit